jgi:hypothetical protein
MRTLVIALLIFSAAAIYFTVHVQKQPPVIAQFQPRVDPKRVNQMVEAGVEAGHTQKLAINAPPKAANPLLITYSISHKQDSKLNTIPLKEAKLNVQVYYYGNPRGQITVVTGKDQTFTIGKFKAKSAVALEVLSLVNENDYKARCRGYAAPGTTEIVINCKDL